MIKRIIFGLLLLLLFTKSLSAQTTNSATGFFFTMQREIVEWRTISKTIPVGRGSYWGGINNITLNQVGTKYLVTFAQIEWKGQTKEFELERTPIKSETAIERTISEFPISITMDN